MGEYDKGSGLTARAKHALILIGFGGLFLPAVAVGQAQTPEIHTGVPPQALSNSNLQALETSEQEVVSYRLMLSDEQSEANPPFEAISMNGAELPRRIFFPHTIRPLAPLWDSSTGASEPSTNADGFVVDRSGNSQHVLGDARNSLTVLEGYSNTFTITLGEPPSGEMTGIITGYENTDLAVSPTQLTFDDSNWNVEQTITVDVKQDADDTDEEVKLTFRASGGGIKESISINVRILDTSPVPVNLSAEQLEVQEGERRKLMVMPLRPFTRSITGDVPLKFKKGTSDRGEDHDAVRHTSIPRGTKSATTEIQMREDDTDADNKRFTVAIDERKLKEKVVVSGDQKELAAINKDNTNPKVCLEISPGEVRAGASTTVKATVEQAHNDDITVSVTFDVISGYISPDIFDNVTGTKGTKFITISKGETASKPFTFKTSWGRDNIEPPYSHIHLTGTTPWEPVHSHGHCLCAKLIILAPFVVRLSASPNPVEEGQPVTIMANVTNGQYSDVTVPLIYPNPLTDTAVNHKDYASLTSITIKAHARSGTGTIWTYHDTIEEDHETFTVAIDENSLAFQMVAWDPKKVEVTITDNDTPEVNFDLSTDSVDEDDGTHNVDLSLSPAPGSDLTLNYTLGGTATENADYSITGSGTVSVTAGLTSVHIPVKITDDNVDDDAETIILTLASGTGYNLGNPSEHTLTITDNDGMPQVNFASAAGSVGEDGGTRDVEVSLSPAPGATLTLSYTLGGTAIENADYSITGSGTISVAANASSAKIPVGIIEDTENEGDETVTLTLTSGTGYTVGSTNVHTLTITDNDMPQVNFASAAGSVDEDDGTYHVAVVISSAPTAPLTLNYTLGGTAIENADYSITGSGTISVSAGATSVNIPIVITDDTEDEPDETVILTLTDGTEYTVGSANVHTLTITDNDEKPQVSFASSSSKAPENEGTHHVAVRINPAPAVPFTLTYGTGGTATENADYSITGSRVISVATGRTSVNIPIGITDDDVKESNETVILTLESGTGYTVGSPGTHTLTIVDNDDALDTPVTVSLSASPNPVDEGESVTITATLSEALSDAVTIELRDISGEPPTEPGDYGPLPSITIAGGSWTGSGTIDIRDDDVSEGDERFTVAIIDALPSGVELGSPSSVEITIVDNDPPPPVEVTLSASPNPVDEGKSVTITARLTGVLETDVVVPLMYNDETGHPPESGDYRPLPGIPISSGETQGSGQIQTLTDADMDDETFIVALGGLPPALLVPGRESSQFVTIRDITSPTAVTVVLSASPNPVDEGNGVTVTATLSEALDTDVEIPLTLTGGTADAQDYEALPPTQIEIESGERSGTYVVSAVQDNVAEQVETFTVALGVLPSGLAKGEPVEITITDDDEAGVNAPPSVSVTEGGETSFGISLTSEPLGEVKVMMTWPSGTDLALIPITQVFTPENWNETQQVSLRAADDADVVNDQVEVTLTASGSVDYTGISETISVTIADNDTPGIVVAKDVRMEEGGTHPLMVRLSAQPSGTVTVTFTGHMDLTLDKPSLVFTTSDWDTPKTVTLTAAEDDDFADDTETLTLTASGGGHAGVTTDITVTITDNDAAALVAPETVQMEEGGTRPLLVHLSASPPGPVTLTFTGHAGTDLTLDKPSLTFTAADWNTPKTVTLTAVEDDEDYADETVGLNVTASGGGYDGVTTDITVTIMDNDERPGPLTITLYDEQALEHAEAIQLPIELSRPVDQVVMVQYTSTAGTAEAGLDYVTSRGIVIFDPGATRGVIEIEVINDEFPEEHESFMVTLSKPRNAIIARETGTGTILDDDGASAILRVEDALVLEEEGMVRFRVLLSHPQRQMISAAYRTRDGTAKAGEDYEASSGVVTMAPGTVEAMIAVPLLKDGLDWREETFTVHLESSKHAEIAKAVGVATIQESTTVSEEVLEAYAARFVRTSSVQVVEALGERFRSGADGAACGAADRAEMARLWYSASSWDPSLGELLAGCRMSATSYSGSFSVWGRGAFRQFNGRDDDALTLRGEVTTGMLGADYRWRGGWLAGVLLAHSQGEGSFEVVQQSGEITAGLTGVYPYVSYARAGWDVWLSAGAGRGQAEVLELKGDLVSRFGAMGVRGRLVSTGTIGLNYHGDVLVTDAEITDHEVTAEVYRVRAGVEANVKISDGLRPFVEANVRSDGGSAETGVGLEFGGGIRVDYPAWRLKGDVRTQGLVMHTADGFTEWGLSGSLQVGSRSEGLMVRVRPSWGRGQGMSMYGQQTILDAVPLGADAQRTELELGYGVPWKDGTARSVMGVTQLHQGVMYRLGGELHPSEWLTFSVFGLAHGRAAVLGDIGVNVRGSLRY